MRNAIAHTRKINTLLALSFTFDNSLLRKKQEKKSYYGPITIENCVTTFSTYDEIIYSEAMRVYLKNSFNSIFLRFFFSILICSRNDNSNEKATFECRHK